MRFSMRFSEKVWEVWDSGKKYDLLPKVWDVEGLHSDALKRLTNKIIIFTAITGLCKVVLCKAYNFMRSKV